MEDEIYTMVQTLAGDQSEREAAVRTLCRAAAAALTARLRDGVSPEDCQDSFVCAAAFEVWAALGDGDAAGGVQSFSAGDLSVTKETGERADKLRAQAEALMAPYVSDSFSFLGVRG